MKSEAAKQNEARSSVPARQPAAEPSKISPADCGKVVEPFVHQTLRPQ